MIDRQKFTTWLQAQSPARSFAQESCYDCALACYLQETQGAAHPRITYERFSFDDLDDSRRPLPEWAHCISRIGREQCPDDAHYTAAELLAVLAPEVAQ